jgi:hypothetical protein
MTKEHAVYVLYYEGAPYKHAARAAYYTEGMAKAAVTRAVDGRAGWRATDEAKAEIRAKFSVKAYVIKPEVTAE